jgi:predicted dinucleotide-utilizing enzyme
MSDKILRAALIGVGNMGKKYVQMIVSGEVSNIKLTAVVIRRDELMEWGETLVNTDGEYVPL